MRGKFNLTFKRSFSTTAPRKMNRGTSTLLEINPNVIQDLPLPEIVQFLIYASASILIVLDLLSDLIDVAVTDSGITTAQNAPVEFMPDIFDTNDEDLPVEYLDRKQWK